MRRLPVVLLLVVAACSAGGESASTTPGDSSLPDGSTTSTSPRANTPLLGLEYQEIATIDFPIHMVARSGDDNAYLATKDGRVLLVEGGAVFEPLLDISDRVRDRGEQGLLSIAVAQDDREHLYVHYSASDGSTVVAEFTFTEQGGPIDPGSERILLRLEQPAPNHNGGMIQFGPDGALYLGLGDGGGANDRFNNGQNRDTLLGGLVRIDPETGESELFQYGLRNPWRFWIDESTIYIADVGQGGFEEISVAPLERGVNYGWPITEGLHCFRLSSGCDTSGQTLPIVEVPLGEAGSCAITGGVVYRGDAIPELKGTFLFSDFCGGYLRGLRNGEVTDFTDQVGVPGQVASFGVDGFGEVYLMTTDRLLKLIPVRE